MDFKKKQKSKLSLNNFLIKSAAFLMIVIFFVLVVADIKIYGKRKGLEAEVARYEQQIKAIKEKNQNLEERIANSDNPDYIEKIAREEQDMQKPGEKVVSFIMPKEKNQDNSVNNNFWSNEWLGSIINWIKKVF